MRLLSGMLFLMLLSAPFRTTESISLKEYDIILEGFNPAQEKIIHETFEYIDSLQSSEIQISRKSYEHYSRFSELFKFAFSGPELLNWIAQRLRILNYENSWTIATNDGNGMVSIGEEFLKSSVLERAYILVHEARHSDGFTISHVVCPGDFPFLSLQEPDSIAAGKRACDRGRDGAYAYQAAFLFEIYARRLDNFQLAGIYYNSSVSRILNDNRGNQQKSDDDSQKYPPEFSQRDEIMKRLNEYETFTFLKGTPMVDSETYYSEKYYAQQDALIRYRVNFYSDRGAALRMYREQKNSGYPIFVIGAIIVHCQSGDVSNIHEKLQVILRGMQILP